MLSTINTSFDFSSICLLGFLILFLQTEQILHSTSAFLVGVDILHKSQYKKEEPPEQVVYEYCINCSLSTD